jgi:V-type H+-transporting ATPase subunit a
MGIFAFYCGLIYNDMTSIALNLFGSCYDPTSAGVKTNADGSAKRIFKRDDCVYPFGMDPVWSISTNGLTFFNGYKMKLAVILGVLQMMFGIFLKGLNAISFK